jgi:hypothetical protein
MQEAGGMGQRIPRRGRRLLPVVPALVAIPLLLSSILVLGGCGSDDESEAGPPDGSLSEFAERCVGVTESFERAEVSFDDAPFMRLNETSEISMAIGAVGEEVEGLPSQGEVLVTCTIDARLVMSPDDATVNPAGWETRRYVPPEPAEWSWLVTPSKPGEIDANIELRPIVVVQSDGGSDTTEYTTRSYDLDITVEQALWDRISALTTQVKVVLGLVTAVTALAVALGVRKWGPALWKGARSRGGAEGAS